MTLSDSAQHSGWLDYSGAAWDERKPIDWLDDWPFWRYCVETYALQGEPVLELACGNGRITRQIALMGQPVVAVDVNPRFLSRAQQNIPDDWQSQVTFQLADVVTLTLEQQFSLVIMADWAFPAILTQEDQLRFLETITQHLKPGGHFIFDTMFPPVRQLGLYVDGAVFEWGDGRTYDPLTAIETRPSGDYMLKFRHTSLSELQLLAQLTGLHITHTYSTHERQPLNMQQGDNLIVILEKLTHE